MSCRTLCLAVLAIAFAVILMTASDWTPAQAAPHPATPVALSGKVVNVAGANVVVADPNGNQTTVAIDANTKVTIDGAATPVANLKAGMSVQVQLSRGVATNITAKSPPPPPPLSGTLVSVDAATGNVVVATIPTVAVGSGKQVPVANNAGKAVTNNGKEGTLAHLLPSLLTVEPNMVIVDANTGKVAVGTTPTPAVSSGKQVTVITNASTVVNITGKADTLAHLLPGMLVAVKFATTGGPATEIDAKSPPSSGTGTAGQQPPPPPGDHRPPQTQPAGQPPPPPPPPPSGGQGNGGQQPPPSSEQPALPPL